MADNHDGERQFESEASSIVDEEQRASEAAERERAEAAEAAAEARRALARAEAREALLKKSGPRTVIDGDSGEVTSEGTDVLAADGQSNAVAVPWPHKVTTFMGDEWEYRIPKPLAAMFLGAASRKAAKPARKVDAIMGYLEHVLSDKSVERMMERAQDHDDDFDIEQMGELIQQITSEGSARPTGSIQR